jgi:hypothetical protein
VPCHLLTTIPLTTIPLTTIPLTSTRTAGRPAPRRAPTPRAARAAPPAPARAAPAPPSPAPPPPRGVSPPARPTASSKTPLVKRAAKHHWSNGQRNATGQTGSEIPLVKWAAKHHWSNGQRNNTGQTGRLQHQCNRGATEQRECNRDELGCNMDRMEKESNRSETRVKQG